MGRLWALAYNTYREAVRDRVLYSILFFAIAVIALSLKTERTIGLLSREDRILPYQLDLGDIVGRLDNGQLLIPAYVGNKGGAIRRNLLRADPDSGRAE